MSVPVSGLIRAALVAAAGAGLVVGAAHLPRVLALAPPLAAGSGATTAERTGAVRGAALVCPGPELKGVPGLKDLPVGVQVGAATAPLRALTGTPPVSEAGKLTMTGMPGGTLGPAVTARGRTTSADLDRASAVSVAGTQALAPGMAADQSWLVPSGDQRALGGAPCTSPGAEFWILAGGGQPGRQERLVLTNPGGNPVSVDITLHGPDGPVSSPNGKGVVVPAYGRTAFLLDSISGDLSAVAVHVVARGGVVAAVVNDMWLDGTRPAGGDDAAAAAAPSRNQVIPAVDVLGPAVLRVVVPGANEAVVQARVLTAQGPRALPTGGVTRVAGGTVHDIDISKLPVGASGLQVRADVPVVASAFTSRGNPANPAAPSEFAWSVSTPAITGVAGLPLLTPGGFTGTLHRQLDISATGDTAGVEVVTVGADGAEKSQRVTVQPDSTLNVDVTGAQAVWLHRVSGKGDVHAGVLTWTTDAQGTLLSVTPLLDSALRTTTVGLREVQH